MIGQYLQQINESATVAKSKNFSHLNKVLASPSLATHPAYIIYKGHDHEEFIGQNDCVANSGCSNQLPVLLLLIGGQDGGAPVAVSVHHPPIFSSIIVPVDRQMALRTARSV